MNSALKILLSIASVASLLIAATSLSQDLPPKRYFQESPINELSHEQAYSYYRGNFVACGLSLLSGESFKKVDDGLFDIFALRSQLPPDYDQVATHIDHEFLLLGENATHKFMLDLTEAEKINFCQELFNHYSEEWHLSETLSEP
ncbi:hypothetical protein KP803_00435 [Vibrio sp. ZSDE26]|uniref:Uncharacterized protein n=1 Tax=Vibrio amylolyticus TaxID=2847292 RepID=A0A9X1XF28_9VIBR|nr:hypothetical protein [Vibrio amylolyticus]MCK6261734.1 hypothetical protein [Vibrio amylolyticus]